MDKSEIVDKIKLNCGLGASDHLSYSACLVCNPEINDSDTVKYNFHEGDYMAISEDLQSTDWQQLEGLDANESWNFFQDKLQESIQKHISLKKKSKKQQKWMERKC